MSLKQKNFINLLQKIGVSEKNCSIVQTNLEIQNLQVDSTTKEVLINIKQLSIINIEIIKEIENKAKKSRFKISLQWEKQFNWKHEINIVQNYIIFFHKNIYINPQINDKFDLSFDEKKLKITLKIPKINFSEYEKELKKFLLKYGIFVEKIEVDQIEIYKNKESIAEKTKILNNLAINEEREIKNKYLENNKKVTEIFGKILTVTEKIFTNNHTFQILLETQEKTFIVYFTKNSKKFNTNILQKYQWIIFWGKNNKNNVFYADSFKKRQPIFKRLDKANNKRVELHVHTKMSALDGIGEIEDYLSYAQAWKHPAIAFTDHENIHIFPECERLSVKYPDVKIIFGCEFEFLSKPGLIISKNIDGLIENQKMVFFDIETTGLSPNFHKIIEFAAIIVENNLIKEKKSFLIKSENKLSEHTQKLTQISQEEYDKNAINIDVALKEIKNVFQDAILIAHNINFDISFINQAFALKKWKKINNPTIDTLNLSRHLDSKLRQHRLGKVAKRYKIHYLKSQAHRAIYDTKVLQQIFEAMINFNKIISFKEIWEMNNNINIRKKLFANHINVLAKNKQGLRDLYHLVSHTHTKTLYRKPVLEKSELEKFKKNLLIGSGCYNGEIFNLACFNTQKELEEAMDFYDYIEVQPPEVYQHLIDKEIINIQNLKQIIKNIIQTAKKLKKIVVATGDVHYLEPKHRMYRDIFVFNKQLGGSFHSLYDSKERVKKTPPQYLRTTEEMLEIFNFLDPDLAYEIVVKNTNIVAAQIEKNKCFDKEFIMPKIINDKTDLIRISEEKLLKKYGKNLDLDLKKRFDHELKQIIKSGYSTIYLISYYLTDYSLKNGYLFSSRGSVGSSFLAFCLDITEVNPLKPHYICNKCFYFEWNKDLNFLSGFDLINKNCPKCNNLLQKNGHEIAFESFLGLNSETIPDIDLNFSGLFQLEAQRFVFDFLTKKLGKNKVFWTGTVSTVAAKSAYGYYKNYLEKKNQTDNLPFAEVQKILFYCSGVKKTTGQHPGGLMIIPKERNILDFTPYNFPSNNTNSDNLTTHFDYHVLKNQLLKIDILGHDDPTGLKMLQEMTKINPKNIDLGDKNVIKLFSDISVLKIKKNNKFKKRSGVLGIPEFGTKFVIKMLSDINVTSFSNLIAVSGLSHGKNVWENNAKNLIQEEKFSLDDVISCRDDILLFLIKNGLEKKFAYQVMNKVKKGKLLNNEEEEEMKRKKIPKWYIESCQKIRYLFPKAHATAYVIMACRFAWFKIYYPHEFYATYFSIRCKVFDLETILQGPEVVQDKYQKIKSKMNIWQQKKDQLSTKEENLMPIYKITLEMFEREIKIVSLDLNLSNIDRFIVKKNKEKNKVIIPPFTSIDGLGIELAKKIVEEREIKNFSSQEDFKIRTRVNQTVFEKLLKLGLFVNLNKSDQNTFDFFD